VAAILQIVGAIGILIPFTANQAGRMQTTSYAYLGLNAVASGLLAALAAINSQWGFLMLEGVWALVSVWGLVSRARDGRRRPHSPTTV
jgi:hypothetical protein